MKDVEAVQWFTDGDHPAVGLFRHPPVDLLTGEVSAADDAVLMGQMRHCDVPEPFRRADCNRLMDDHGYIDLETAGHTVCPGDRVTAAGLPARPSLHGAAVNKTQRQVRRCQQPSAKNATGPDAYTTCHTPLDGENCPNAGSHVEL